MIALGDTLAAVKGVQRLAERNQPNRLIALLHPQLVLNKHFLN